MLPGAGHPSSMVETVSLSFVEPPDLQGDEAHASLLPRGRPLPLPLTLSPTLTLTPTLTQSQLYPYP